MGGRRGARSSHSRRRETTVEAGVEHKGTSRAAEQSKHSLTGKLHQAGNRVLGGMLRHGQRFQSGVEFIAREDARRVLAEYVSEPGASDTIAAMNAIVAELDGPFTEADAHRQFVTLPAAFSLLDADGAARVLAVITQPAGKDQQRLSEQFHRLNSVLQRGLLAMLRARARAAAEATGVRENARLKELIAVDTHGRTIGLAPRTTGLVAAQAEATLKVSGRGVLTAAKEVGDVLGDIVEAPVHLVRSVLAFVVGVVDGVKQSLSLDQVERLITQIPKLRDVPLFAAAFVKGLATGIYDEGRAIVEQAIDIISHPVKFLGDMLGLAKSMLGAEGAELGQVMGTETGRHYGGKIASLGGRNTWDFGRGLGEITGPAVVAIILSLLGAQIVKLSSEVIARLSKFKVVERLLEKYGRIRPHGGKFEKRGRHKPGRGFDEEVEGVRTRTEADLTERNVDIGKSAKEEANTHGATGLAALNKTRAGALKELAGKIHGLRRRRGQAIAVVEVRIGGRTRYVAASNASAKLTGPQRQLLNTLDIEIAEGVEGIEEAIHAEHQIEHWVKTLRNKNETVEVVRWGISAGDTGAFICSGCRAIVEHLGGVIEEFGSTLGRRY